MARKLANRTIMRQTKKNFKFCGFSRSSSCGASLIELMVGIGILSGVATAGLTLAGLAGRAGESVRTKNAAEVFEQRLQALFESSELCVASLGNSPSTNPNPVNLPSGGVASWKAGGGSGFAITMHVPNAKSGPGSDQNLITSSTTGDANYLPESGLKIDRFYLADAVGTGVPKEWVGRVFLQTSRINDSGAIAMSPKLIGGLVFSTTGNNGGKITSCQNGYSKSAEQLCLSLDGACIYDSANNPPCDCPLPVIGCNGPGLFPVSVVNGVVVCKPLGGKACPPGTVLLGVGLGRVDCMDIDAITIDFAAPFSTVAEGSTANIKIEISEPQYGNVVFVVDVAPSSSYQADLSADFTPNILASYTLTIPQGSGQVIIPARAVPDSPEFDEELTFTIRKTAPKPLGVKTIVVGTRDTHKLTVIGPACTSTGTYKWPDPAAGPCEVTGGPTSIAKFANTGSLTNSAAGYTGSALWACDGTGALTLDPGYTCNVGTPKWVVIAASCAAAWVDCPGAPYIATMAFTAPNSWSFGIGFCMNHVGRDCSNLGAIYSCYDIPTAMTAKMRCQ